MRILVTGACGFVGSTLIRRWVDARRPHDRRARQLHSARAASRIVAALRALGVALRHADIRSRRTSRALPAVDVVIDAAANPSVLAGVDGQTSSRQLVEHNLVGTVNVLEYCRRHQAALIILSTSRVYSIPPLAALPVRVADDAFEPDARGPAARGPDARRASTKRFSTAAAGFAVRRDQAGERAAGARVRRDLRVSRVGEPLRRPGRRGTVRPRRSGHLCLLGQQLAARPPVALHRLRRPRVTRCATACIRPTSCR